MVLRTNYQLLSVMLPMIDLRNSHCASCLKTRSFFHGFRGAFPTLSIRLHARLPEFDPKAIRSVHGGRPFRALRPVGEVQETRARAAARNAKSVTMDPMEAERRRREGEGGWVGLSLVGFGWSWLELLGWLGWVGLGLVLINYDHRCCCLHC